MADDGILGQLDQIEAGEADDGPIREEFIPSHDNLKFTTKQFALQVLLDKAASVLPTKELLPVLANFRLEVTDGRISVVATDLELSVLATTEMVRVETEGVAVFPGRRMLAIVSEAGDGDLECDVVDGTAAITVGKTSWSIKLQDGSDYPELPKVDGLEFHKIEKTPFQAALGSVRYAASTEASRPALMMVDVKGGSVRASDGGRYQEASFDPDFDLDFQIPLGAVDDLLKLLRSTEVTAVEVALSNHHLVFRIGSDIFLASKLMLEFPDMDKQIRDPAMANDQELVLDREALLRAVRRVRITADPETSAVVLQLTKNGCVVRSQDKRGNHSEEALEATWAGSKRSVVVNHRFLMDLLRMVDTPTCSFWLGAETKTRRSPLLLKTEAGMGIVNQMRMDWVT